MLKHNFDFPHKISNGKFDAYFIKFVKSSIENLKIKMKAKVLLFQNYFLVFFTNSKVRSKRIEFKITEHT